MKTYLDCLPCFMNQALRAGRIATRDETKIKELLNEVGLMIKEIPMENTLYAWMQMTIWTKTAY